MGEAPKSWGSEYDIWLRKRGEATQDDKPHFLYGHLMESGVIIPLYEKAMKDIGKRAVVKRVPTRRHPDIECVIDSVDGIVYSDETPFACLEAKTVHFSQKHMWGKPGTDHIPKYYWLQCQWHMGVHGLESCHVPAHFAGNFDVDIYKVRRDRETFDAMAQAAVTWWRNHMIKNIAPPVGGSEQTTQHLACEYKNPDDERVPAPPQAYHLRERLSKALRTKDTVEATIDTLKNKIRAIIGNHRGVVFDDGECLDWTRFEQQRTSWKDVAKEMGATDAVISKYTKATTGHRLNIPPAWKEAEG